MDYLKEDHCLFGKEVWVKDSVMIGIAVVGCTGKSGINIVKEALNRKDMELRYAIVRKGNQFVGHKILCLSRDCGQDGAERGYADYPVFGRLLSD